MLKPSRPLPPLNALRAFEVAARHLNFRLAAEEIGVTQGAVAQQIRGLEATLGLKLFDRHPRTLALTEAGRAYAVHIRRAFEMIAEATETLRPQPQHLTVSVTPSFASRWLIPRLPDFADAHPDIDLRILASDRLSDFQTDAVDLAVRHARPPFGPGLAADLLFEQCLIAVASPLLVEKLGPPDAGANFSHYMPCCTMGTMRGRPFWTVVFRRAHRSRQRIFGSIKRRWRWTPPSPGKDWRSPADFSSKRILPPGGLSKSFR